MAKRNWVFTLNNPEETGEVLIARLSLEDKIRYTVFQLERGENETPHFQGYIELNKPQRMSGMKKLIPRAHFEGRKGTRQQARDYCMKQDTRVAGPWEHGTFSAGGQGRRNDITKYKDAILSGKRRSELLEEYPLQCAKYPKLIGFARGAYRPPIKLDRIVRLNYGATGTGKTRFAYDTFGEDLYDVPVSSGQIWFDNYDSQKAVLLDDFAGRASKMTLNYVLKLLDIYPIQVPVKGSFVWWDPDYIVITTNIHPYNWYEWEGREEQYRALMRRITHIYEYKEDGEVSFISEELRPRWI